MWGEIPGGVVLGFPVARRRIGHTSGALVGRVGGGGGRGRENPGGEEIRFMRLLAAWSGVSEISLCRNRFWVTLDGWGSTGGGKGGVLDSW